MDSKANIALAVVAVILALVILAIFLGDVANRECSSNKDCAENSYCGADNECHQYPDKILVQESNYVPAALILGIAIIIAAYIYRGGKIPFLNRE
ncbi:MAG: hypothetical protein AABX37_06010 [Nanoarchaeota archaeon]